MTTSISNMNPYSYSGASGKLYVPVSPSAVIYAQFDHISGVAAPSGQSGVSVSKIQILNTLIENLSKIKSTAKLPVKDDSAVLTQSQIDTLIKNYQKQLQNAVSGDLATLTLSGVKPNTASLFSIEV